MGLNSETRHFQLAFRVPILSTLFLQLVNQPCRQILVAFLPCRLNEPLLLRNPGIVPDFLPSWQGLLFAVCWCWSTHNRSETESERSGN